MEDAVICFRFDFAIDDAVISKEPYWRLNVVVYVIKYIGMDEKPDSVHFDEVAAKPN